MPNIERTTTQQLRTALLNFSENFGNLYEPGEGQENRIQKLDENFSNAVRPLERNAENFDFETFNEATSGTIKGMLDDYAGEYRKLGEQLKARIEKGPKDLRNNVGLAAVNGIQAYLKACGKGYDPCSENTELEGGQLFRGALNIISTYNGLGSMEEANDYEEYLNPVIDFLNQSADLLNKQVEYEEAKASKDGISAEQDLKYREEIFALNESLNQKAKGIIESANKREGNEKAANKFINNFVNRKGILRGASSLQDFMTASDEYLAQGKPQINQELVERDKAVAPKNVIPEEDGNRIQLDKTAVPGLKKIEIERFDEKAEAAMAANEFPNRVNRAMDSLTSRRWFVYSGGTTEYTELRDLAKQFQEKFKLASTNRDKKGNKITDKQAEEYVREAMDMASNLKTLADRYIKAKTVDRDRENANTPAGKDRLEGARQLSQIAADLMKTPEYEEYMASRKIANPDGNVIEENNNIINTGAGNGGGSFNEMSFEEVADKVGARDNSQTKSFERPKPGEKADEKSMVGEQKTGPVLDNNVRK